MDDNIININDNNNNELNIRLDAFNYNFGGYGK